LLSKTLVTPLSQRLKITVSIGTVKLVIPVEATTSQTPSRPRVRKGNGQFATSAPLLDSLDAAPAATFHAVLIAVGDKKIEVIKTVSDLTRLGLKEAKDLVEDAPSIIKEGVSRVEAERVKSALENVGATVALQPCRERGNGQSAPQHVVGAGYGA
jgi:ribosomal protein L7/L12